MNNEVNSLQLGKLSSQPTQIPEQNDLNLTHLKGRCPEDFDLLSIIGEGSYATVYLGKYKTSGKLYAVKVLDKRHMVREGKAKYAAVEKEALRKLSPHPYIVRLYYTFQDTYKLYFVLGYAKNGELLYYIRKLGSFGLDCVKFYSAELILAMEYMHSKGIVHRDIKPENLLLCENMHLILADFGTAKIISLVQDDSPLGRVSSFVGTADYVSPELLNYKRTSISSDLWALGCIIYQLIAGWPPFRGGTDYLTFQKVSNLDYTIPDGFPEEAADLIKQILVLDPQQRLGSNSRGGYENLKGHIFFEEVLWEQLHETTPPELKPYLPLADGPRGLTSEMNVGGDGILAHTAKNSLTASLTNDTNDYRHYTEAEESSIVRRALLLKRQSEINTWSPYVPEGELIVYTSPVVKRRGFFSKYRQLILTDAPRLIFVNLEKKLITNTLTWSQDLKPELKTLKTFFIHTRNRTYYLEDPSGNAKVWVDYLNSFSRRKTIEVVGLEF